MHPALYQLCKPSLHWPRRLCARVEQVPPDEHFIRLGFHAGPECITQTRQDSATMIRPCYSELSLAQCFVCSWSGPSCIADMHMLHVDSPSGASSLHAPTCSHDICMPGKSVCLPRCLSWRVRSALCCRLRHFSGRRSCCGMVICLRRAAIDVDCTCDSQSVKLHWRRV